MHSYIAYIDESGDDGLGNYREPEVKGGASSWIVLTACVMRFSRRLEAVSIRDEIKEKTGKRTNGRGVHFAELNHGQKRAACSVLNGKPVRFISIICHKPSLDADNFQDKNQLYFYLGRFLLERISWICRDHRSNVPEGNGRVKIIFSRRGGMSYSDFRGYMKHLKNSGECSSVHWPIIDIDAIEAKDHSTDAGLQLADCGASATASAFEPDRYGNCESQYLHTIRDLIYERGSNYLSYGMKFHPSNNEVPLDAQQTVSLQMFR